MKKKKCCVARNITNNINLNQPGAKEEQKKKYSKFYAIICSRDIFQIKYSVFLKIV